ncbi:hypothetical protein MBLNU459_g5599t1 [Dothideomycetes sp. NU459]
MSTDSSPDPLSILAEDCPPVTRGRGRRGPLAPRSSNINSSPSKSVVLETKGSDGCSPWRIKVTVQAETTTGRSAHVVNRTTTIPLRDAETSPVKRRSRPRKTNATSPVRKDRSRKPTPARRRCSQPKPTEITQESMTGHETILSDSGVNAYFNDVQPTSKQATDLTHDQPYLENEGQEPDFLGHAPGEATMLESEEFSMISVDSLTSNNRPDDSSSPAQLSNADRPSGGKTTAKNINLSYMPSSPPVFLRDRTTPAPPDLPLTYPAAPVQHSYHQTIIATPLQQSAKQSGRALQNVLNGPFRESVSKDISSRDSLSAAFSAGTQRQLRQSLHVGQDLATQQPVRQPGLDRPTPILVPSAPTVLSPFQSPVRNDSSNNPTVDQSRHQNRLLTPEEHGRVFSVPTSQVEGEVQYPSLTKRVQQSPHAGPYSGYDDMSWVATGPPKHIPGTGLLPQMNEPLIPLVMTHTANNEDAIDYSLSEMIQTEPAHNDRPQEEEQAEAEGDDQDIWQEEASRCSNEYEQRSAPIQQNSLSKNDPPIKPPRGKLPGTWRRISGANFHYSDSPEPEETRTRKCSATTNDSSRKSSGILTPPATEDESCIPEEESDCQDDQSQTHDTEDVESVVTPSEAEGFISDGLSSDASPDASPDADDTGLFWHANLPAVYRRSEQSSMQTSRLASLAAPRDPIQSSPGKTFAPTSPLRNTILDLSPIRKIEPQTVQNRADEYEPNLRRRIKAPHAVSSPLRHSLYKSSKAATSPLGQVPVEHSLSELSNDPAMMGLDRDCNSEVQGEQLSMPSDACQLHEELVTGNESSLASDARQLHVELAQHYAPLSGAVDAIGSTHPSSFVDESLAVSGPELTGSYHEELNRESPMRIRVNFNDSINSSIIAPRKNYPPLFQDIPASPSMITPDKGRKEGASVVARLTSSFWEAVTAPPVYAPATAPARIVKESPQDESSGSTTPDHVLRLRRKYGLLPDRHPFTYTHVRTLHRMLNSTRSRPERSIVPNSGVLSPALTALVGTKCTNELDQHFTWTEQSLQVVSAFCSLLLPASERFRLEEVKAWGDAEALRFREADSKGRQGGERVFSEQKKGKIEDTYIADVLVGIIFKEEMNARKMRIRDMMRGLESSEAGTVVEPHN